MSPEVNKRQEPLEIFKTLSTFLSSVVIALATFFATRDYNSKQLEISRNKELAILIPKLGDSDINVRRFSAISLALYGENAVPALIALLNDEKQEVRNAAATSLSIIGNEAVPKLMSAYSDKRKDDKVRAGALYALGLMRNEKAYDLALAALRDRGEDAGVRVDAAEVLGFLKEKRAVKTLLAVIRENEETDTELISKSLGALSKIKDVSETKDIRRLLFDSHEGVRLWALWAVKEIRDTSAINDLHRVDSIDGSDKVRQYAREVLTLLTTKKESLQ